jgi:hypothetical protein
MILERQLMSQEERVEILKSAPPNSWIALSQDESRVVGMGATYGEASERAKDSGESDPLLIKTPEQWLDLVLLCA